MNTRREVLCDAVLFDCDGVLVDSRRTAEQAWTSWAVSLDLDPERVLHGIHGRRSQDTVRLHVSPRRRRDALELIEQIEIATAGRTDPIPGGPELFGQVADRCAVVTSASRSLTLARLEAAGYPPPAVVVAAEDVRAGKPRPEGYLRAAALLETSIHRCSVVEDSTPGAQAARAAGASGIVIVGGGVQPSDSDIAVTDLRSVSWTGRSLAVAD